MNPQHEIPIDVSRYIQDPLHGSIALSAIESQVIDHPVFQRLRNIKQLGNASMIFPGATHSRFCHAVGVMHQAGELFESLTKSIVRRGRQPLRLRRSLGAVLQRVRLAGLLHDIGHGPFSHHFEHYLEKEGATVADLLGTELAVPLSWIQIKSRSGYLSEGLRHEHFSAALIGHIGLEELQARAVLSLLDGRFLCGAAMETDLRCIAEAAGAPGSSWQSILECLRSLISSEIDADRMDYLRRDAYFCGVSVAFDAAHLVRSLDLSFQDGRFVIAVERNAIFALEQLLLARKQMFSQVYQNRVNLLLDDLLSRSVDRIHECGKLSVPRTVSEFVRLDDIWMIQCMKELVADNVVAGTAERVSDLALKMYLTRSLPVTLETREIRAEEWEQTRKLMQRTYPRGTLLCTPAKKLLEQEVRSLAALGSRTPRRKNPDMPQPTGVLYTQEHKGKPMVAVAQVSELIRSTAWKIPTFRVIVTKTLAESAKERGLEDKLLTMVWPTSTKAQGEDNANTLQNTRHSHSPKAESMGASSASRRLRVIASARQRTSR